VATLPVSDPSNRLKYSAGKLSGRPMGFPPQSYFRRRCIQSGFRPRAARKAASFYACLLSVMLLAPSPSFASLGGDLNSVLSDQVQFQGSETVAQMGSYEVHEIQMHASSQASTSPAATSPAATQSATKPGSSAGTSPTIVREYVSPAGVVFAVTWHGPLLPNMRQLLGSHFQQFVDAVKQSSSRPGRRPLQVSQPDFVVQMSGNPRSHAGRVYLPGMLPAGLQPEAIQ
jgi:Protein of unknown function (DUF2844)